jgi:glucosamine-6-phosphate deaminase
MAKPACVPSSADEAERPAGPEPTRTLKLAGGIVRVYADAERASAAGAELLATVIRVAVAERNKAVLGLATGATPERLYAHLVSLHRAGKLSFERVVTFNLDEYYPIDPLDPQSYRSYMNRHLFGHVNLAPNHTHLFDGTVPEAFVAEHAAQFDRWIAAAGGLDVQLLGIGRNGHIGFNEPSDQSVEQALLLPSRLMELHPTTLASAARDFGSAERVPRTALTMGVAQILSARSVLVLAFGNAKAEIVGRCLSGPRSAQVPGSLLQTIAERVTWILDEPAAARLG